MNILEVTKVKEYKKWITDYVKSLKNKEVVIRQNKNCIVRYPGKEK